MLDLSDKRFIFTQANPAAISSVKVFVLRIDSSQEINTKQLCCVFLSVSVDKKNNREGLCDSDYDVRAVAATAVAVKLTVCTNKYDRRRCSAVRQTIDCTVVFYFVHKTKKDYTSDDE